MRRRDEGYAMIAVVAGAAAFAFIAFETISYHRGAVASVHGQVENAELRAAADAGLAAAIHGLALPDASKRWSVDGSPRTLQFADTELTIVVEDEHGKIPINRLNEDEIRRMFMVAGAKGEQLDQLVDTMQDWMDDDDDPRPHGAEAPDYAPEGIAPRNGDFESVGELALIKGMDKPIYDRLAPAVTVFFGETGAFSVDDAQPLALAVMSDEKLGAADVIQRQREMSGETAAFQSQQKQPPNLIGRPVTVRITVRDAEGGTYRQATIIELTSDKRWPWWVRFLE
jgi:general secretion pathway protein K